MLHLTVLLSVSSLVLNIHVGSFDILSQKLTNMWEYGQKTSKNIRDIRRTMPDKGIFIVEIKTRRKKTLQNEKKRVKNSETSNF